MRKRAVLLLCLATQGLALSSCGDESTTGGEQQPENGDTEFIATLRLENQDGLENQNGNFTDDTSSSTGGTASNTSGGASPANAANDAKNTAASGDAERAITEADIIQMDGDRLFALSRYSGLTIVDISDPRELVVEGTHHVAGVPFEMYRNDDVLVTMFNAYGRYVVDEQTQQTRWAESSRVQAIDAGQPSRVKVLADLQVPGSISDSRLVGDVLYLVTTEYACWGCSERPSTVVTSFDLSDLANVEQVDQLRFEEPAETYIGQRSITVTEERIYIGGRDWNWDDAGDAGSRIQVVDISDPSGDLVEGTTLQVAGHIDSRWQMDEYEGTLRVLSQWETWRSDSPPALQTYRVVSSSQIEPLARLDVELPRPEILQSVRFDGLRAYAITFEQTDPLFTFDLSDPTSPKQLGELEIPGWVFHMEPRGDRLYAIGFDQSVPDNSLHVSLFNVEDLANPTLAARVNFGGDWGSFAEDQDRIHRSFRLLEEGFMVVPFSGWENDENTGCHSTYHSGIQLVDYTRDELTLRDVAPQLGEARRAFVHDGHLFGVGDDAVQTFDISDRDAIQKLDTLETARNISTVRVVGDQVLRFGSDWWTERSVLDVTNLDDADKPSPQTELDLAALLDDADFSNCNGYAVWGNAYVHDDYAYVSRTSSKWENNTNKETLEFFIVDLAAPDGPTLVGKFAPEPITSGAGENISFGSVVQTDSALLVHRMLYKYSTDQSAIEETHSYEVFDLSNPAMPTSAAVLELPSSLVNQGFGRYAKGCGVDLGWGWGESHSDESSIALVSGNVIASSHVEPLADDPTRGKYFLDRFDVSDPTKPRMLPTINIPGRVLYYADAESRVLTLEERIEPVALGEQACWEQTASDPRISYHWEQDGGYCQKVERVLNWLTIEGDTATRMAFVAVDADGWHMNAASVSDQRVFVEQFQSRLAKEEPGAESNESWAGNTTRLLALDGKLKPVTSFELSSGAGDTLLRARGTRAFITATGEISVFDTSDRNAPTSYTRELKGGWCYSLEVGNDHVLCAQGKQGVEQIELR